MSKSPVQEFFDSLAPNWDAHANDDLTSVRRLLAWAGVRRGGHVLDVGCGTGVISNLLHEMTGEDVLGIDVSEEMIRIAKEKHRAVSGVAFLATDFIHYTGKPADMVVIYNAYPHFIDREALCQALLRNLAPRGRFAVVHSLSRARLDAHHHGLSTDISRCLLPVAEEAGFFQDWFEIDVCSESDDHYLFAGIRRE